MSNYKDRLKRFVEENKDTLENLWGQTKEILEKTKEGLFSTFSGEFYETWNPQKAWELFESLFKEIKELDINDKLKLRVGEVLRVIKIQYLDNPKNLFEQFDKNKFSLESDEKLQNFIQKKQLTYKSLLKYIFYFDRDRIWEPKTWEVLSFFLKNELLLDKEEYIKKIQELQKLKNEIKELWKKEGEIQGSIDKLNSLLEFLNQLVSKKENLRKKLINIFDKELAKKTKDVQTEFSKKKDDILQNNDLTEWQKYWELAYLIVELQQEPDDELTLEDLWEDLQEDVESTTIDDVTKRTAEALVDVFNIEASTVDTLYMQQKYVKEVVWEESREQYNNKKFLWKVWHNITDRRRQKKKVRWYLKNQKDKWVQIYQEEDETLQTKISSTAKYAYNTDKSWLWKDVYKRLWWRLKTFESQKLNDLANEYYKTKNKDSLIEKVNELFTNPNWDQDIINLKNEYIKQGVEERQIWWNVVEQIIESVDSKRKDINIFNWILNWRIDNFENLKIECHITNDDEQIEQKLPSFILSYMQAKKINDIKNIDFNNLQQTLLTVKSSSVCNQLSSNTDHKFRVLITAYKVNKIKDLSAVDMSDKKWIRYKIWKFFAEMWIVWRIWTWVAVGWLLSLWLPVGSFAYVAWLAGWRILRNWFKKFYEQTKEVEDLYNKYVWWTVSIEDLKDQLAKYQDILDTTDKKALKVLSNITWFGKYNEARKKVSIIKSVLEKSKWEENTLLDINNLKNNLKKPSIEQVSQVLALWDAHIKTWRQFIRSSNVDNAEKERLELQEAYQQAVLNLVEQEKIWTKSDLNILRNKNHPLYTQKWLWYNKQLRKKREYKKLYKDLVKWDKKRKKHFSRIRTKETAIKMWQTFVVKSAMIWVSAWLHWIYEHFRWDHHTDVVDNSPEHGWEVWNYTPYDWTTWHDLLAYLHDHDWIYQFDLWKYMNWDVKHDMWILAKFTKPWATVKMDISSWVSREPASWSFVSQMQSIHKELIDFIDTHHDVLSNWEDVKAEFSNENIQKWMEHAQKLWADTWNQALAQTRKMWAVLEYLKELDRQWIRDVKLDVHVDVLKDQISPSWHWANDDLYRNVSLNNVFIDNHIPTPVPSPESWWDVDKLNWFGWFFVPIERWTYWPATTEYFRNLGIEDDNWSNNWWWILNKLFNKNNQTDNNQKFISSKEANELINEIEPWYCIYTDWKKLKNEEWDQIAKWKLIVIEKQWNNFKVVDENLKEHIITKNNLKDWLVKWNVAIYSVISQDDLNKFKDNINKQRIFEQNKNKVENWKNDGEVIISFSKDLNDKNIKKDKPYIIEWNNDLDKFEIFEVDNEFNKENSITKISKDILIKFLNLNVIQDDLTDEYKLSLLSKIREKEQILDYGNLNDDDNKNKIKNELQRLKKFKNQLWLYEDVNNPSNSGVNNPSNLNNDLEEEKIKDYTEFIKDGIFKVWEYLKQFDNPNQKLQELFNDINQIPINKIRLIRIINSIKKIDLSGCYRLTNLPNIPSAFNSLELINLYWTWITRIKYDSLKDLLNKLWEWKLEIKISPSIKFDKRFFDNFFVKYKVRDLRNNLDDVPVSYDYQEELFKNVVGNNSLREFAWTEEISIILQDKEKEYQEFFDNLKEWEIIYFVQNDINSAQNLINKKNNLIPWRIKEKNDKKVLIVRYNENGQVETKYINKKNFVLALWNERIKLENKEEWFLPFEFEKFKELVKNWIVYFKWNDNKKYYLKSENQDIYFDGEKPFEWKERRISKKDLAKLIKEDKIWINLEKINNKLKAYFFESVKLQSSVKKQKLFDILKLDRKESNISWDVTILKKNKDWEITFSIKYWWKEYILEDWKDLLEEILLWQYKDLLSEE